MSDKHIVKTDWKGNMTFESDINGHKLVMDAVEEAGGSNAGPSPKKLQLSALAGCTGMDVVSILHKMRVEFDDLSIEVQADLAEEHPKFYNRMHVIYRFKGQNLPMDKLEKAVNMSEERYCGVGALYRKAIEVTSEIVVEE